MMYQDFSQKDWSAFSNLNSAVADIDQKCRAVLDKLRNAFLQESMIGTGACQIELTGAPSLPATLASPLGEGRFVRSYCRSDSDLQGVLVLQHKRVDEFDRQIWMPVWMLTVPRYESPYIGTKDNALRFDLSNYVDNRGIEAFAMAMTVLDAMVDHPEDSKSQRAFGV